MVLQKDLLESIVGSIEANKELLFQISKFIHAHPEPNYQEFSSSKHLASELVKLGYDVEYPYSGLQTAFNASMTGGLGPGSTVAILAEFDALAVTMPDGTSSVVHACGHNLNAAAAIGAALAMKSIIQKIPGTVRIIGTPAEEGGGGKVALLEAGVFKNVDEVLIVHGDQRDWYTVARACTASDFFRVTFLGKSASDGYSKNYVNSMDAVALFLHALLVLDTRLTSDSLVQRRLTSDAHAINSIPTKSEVEVQIRSGDETYLETLKQAIISAAEGAAQSVGATAQIEQTGYKYERIIENKTLEAVAKSSIEQLGHPFTQDEPSPYPFGTDTGNLSHHIPTVQFLIGRPEGFKFHSPEAVQQSISASAQAMMIESAKILASTATSLLLDPETVKTARKELDGYAAAGFDGLYSWHKKS
jgi:amidohydrolase